MRKAFTLVELIISIALVLIIILGVNAIFKMASDTVNAGQALGSANRDNRAVQSVIYQDFQNILVDNGPMLVIRSERVAAFRNRADQLADRDGNPLTEDYNSNNLEGEGGVPGELTTPLVYNNRNHRIDRVSFFVNSLYRRQTGTERATGTAFIDVSDAARPEAYAWYGHLMQPNPNDDPLNPGRKTHLLPGELPTTAKPNPNNFFATDWVLGRSVTAVSDSLPLIDQTTGTISKDSPNFIGFTPPTNSVRLPPLDPGTKSKDADASGVRDSMISSRYDLAKTSASTFRSLLFADIAAFGVMGTPGGKPVAWWEILGGRPGPLSPGTDPLAARFQGYPYPDRPLTAYGVSRTVPVFVRGCTQFIVEFAGDYLEQNPNTGTITGTYLDAPPGSTLRKATDGEIDYVIVNEQSHPSDPIRQVRRVRWYGMPRNVDITDDAAGPTIVGGTSKQNLMRDVVPLRDLLESAGAIVPQDHFEHFVNLDKMPNYAALAGGPSPNYYAAWGPAELAKGNPKRPKMIRITLTVDDPNGRLAQGQMFEYVLNLP